MPTNSKLPVHRAQHRKLEYAFSPVPSERHPRWFEVTTYQRFVGLEVALLQYGNGSRPPGIPVGQDWLESVCRSMAINGRDRKYVKPALEALFEAGLLVVRDGMARVLFTAEELAANAQKAALREPCGVLPVSYRDPTGILPVSLSDLTPQNDSTHTSQIREEEIRIEERETRAREVTPPIETSETPPAVEPTPPAEPAPPNAWSDRLEFEIRCEFEKRFELAAQAIPNQKQLTAMSYKLAYWIRQTARLRNVTETQLATTLLERFFASPAARAEGFPPAFLAANPLEYLEPKPGLVKAAARGNRRDQLLEELRKRGREIQAELQSLDAHSDDPDVLSRRFELDIELTQVRSRFDEVRRLAEQAA